MQIAFLLAVLGGIIGRGIYQKGGGQLLVVITCVAVVIGGYLGLAPIYRKGLSLTGEQPAIPALSPATVAPNPLPDGALVPVPVPPPPPPGAMLTENPRPVSRTAAPGSY